MLIDCIADLHGNFPELPGGDLLIVAGDLTARDTHEEYCKFIEWIVRQDYRSKIVVAGNHDNILQNDEEFFHTNRVDQYYDLDYLCDSGTTIEYEEECFPPKGMEGLDVAHSIKKKFKIWGSPWTKTFPGMNPHCKAFTCETEKELAEKWALIPKEIDILITHSPPNCVLDELRSGENVGSDSLIKPMIMSGCRLHVYGHVHEAYGKFYNPINGITYVNASHVNEHYQPVNKPIRIEL